jgi:hypothetical protein
VSYRANKPQEVYAEVFSGVDAKTKAFLVSISDSTTEFNDVTKVLGSLVKKIKANEVNFGKDINLIKSISDEVIYHPVKYKILFGDKADTKFQATFKVVKNANEVVNNDDIKVRVIQAINQYFALENWDFGDVFYFSELSAYVMNQLAPDIVIFVIVPAQSTQAFGSLFEIKSESDEIFISGATVNDVEIIDAVTASRLKASGTVVTSTSTLNVGITSAAAGTSSSGDGSYSYP